MAACAFQKLHLFICYGVQWVIGSPQENLACPQTTALPLKCGFCLTGKVCRKVVDADDMAFNFVLHSFWINNDKDLDVFFGGQGGGKWADCKTTTRKGWQANFDCCCWIEFLSELKSDLGQVSTGSPRLASVWYSCVSTGSMKTLPWAESRR